TRYSESSRGLGDVYKRQGQYFFSTREGTLEGPYFTRYDAEREIDAYIRRMRQSSEIQAKGTG
ncbi:DUF6316 family protein, partial [Pseudomonas aeruginosa]|uniref:DUF6316 family protein n=1 Tax=Pseudomonas aeruginosa TaxID=287 RepID=UPI0024585FE0